MILIFEVKSMYFRFPGHSLEENFLYFALAVTKCSDRW